MRYFIVVGVCLMGTSALFAQSAQVPQGNIEQGQMVGLADVVRSTGMNQLQTSYSGVQTEVARQLYIQNQGRAVQGYLDLRRYNREARTASRGSPLSTEQYVRQAREQAPERLRPTQLDTLTGSIHWPLPLMKVEYQGLRQRLDQLFTEWAEGMAVYGEVRIATAQFTQQLQADMATFTANDYIVARHFIERLQDVARVIEQ